MSVKFYIKLIKYHILAQKIVINRIREKKPTIKLVFHILITGTPDDPVPVNICAATPIKQFV
jgi:hypothetical protein